MDKYKIEQYKFYKSENSSLIVQAIETTNSFVFKGYVINDHIHFERGDIGTWFTASFTEVKYVEQIVQNDLFPIY